ncbi:hypothetical protein FRB93_001275 [Tulasnella sp. JGI-2019a]|nr:hypothetical protein FRB93_001275 [Tulasnella sp. JGI-2019a]
MTFTPTPASIPPKDALYKMAFPSGASLPVHFSPLNPVHFILRAALIYPNHLAVLHPGAPGGPVQYTYATWVQRIQNLAYALKKYGIMPGDRVAVISPNCPLIADALQATLAARAVLCPINTRLTKAEVSYILEHSGSKLILVDYEFASLVEGAKVPVVVSNDTGRAGDPYERFLDEGRAFSQERGWPGLELEPNEDANATLCYTSGTTGRPKGVISTCRGSYLAAVANAYETKIERNSVYLWILPMFHAAGWTYPWAITFAFATQICMRSVRYPDIWRHFLESNVTHYCAAPTVQIGIFNSPEARRLTNPVRAIIAGSAPTAHLIAELEKLNIEVTHVYGLTETYGPFTRCYPQQSWDALPLAERAKLMARQGHAFATSEEARVVYQPACDDPAELDKPLVDVKADGKTLGEIVTRGNIVMKEYFNDPEATRKAFRGGFFATGDLAVRFPDGSVSILDRAKDLLISGGENASTLAIEQELVTHPDVLEVAVVARDHPKWGERAHAFVVLHPSAVDKHSESTSGFEESLKGHAKERLPGFARPEWVEVVGDLPKTSTGKIQKNVLRNKLKGTGGVKAKL